MRTVRPVLAEMGRAVRAVRAVLSACSMVPGRADWLPGRTIPEMGRPDWLVGLQTQPTTHTSPYHTPSLADLDSTLHLQPYRIDKDELDGFDRGFPALYHMST